MRVTCRRVTPEIVDACLPTPFVCGTREGVKAVIYGRTDEGEYIGTMDGYPTKWNRSFKPNRKYDLSHYRLYVAHSGEQAADICAAWIEEAVTAAGKTVRILGMYGERVVGVIEGKDLQTWDYYTGKHANNASMDLYLPLKYE